jgi:cyclin-dependent kinase 10
VHCFIPLLIWLNSEAYGVVFRARDRTSTNVVALKQIRLSLEERQNGVPITALREISILRSLKHTNIVNVLDVAVGDTGLDEIYMVMEYAEQVGDRHLI